MTLHAVEAGLPRGAQPQAAALLLAALQVCLGGCRERLLKAPLLKVVLLRITCKT
jgi:hypothetical protein